MYCIDFNFYYNSEDDFAIILHTKQNDEVILCKTKEGATFNEIYDIMGEKTKAYVGRNMLSVKDGLKVPNIKFNEKKEFTELENKEFEFANGEKYFIEKAIQTIQFELNRKGGKLKREAVMAAKNTAVIVEEARYFMLNDTFTIFLREKEKQKEYFSAKIEDITRFQ